MEKKTSAKKPRSKRRQGKRSATRKDRADLVRMRKALGAHIRRLREEHRLSQTELARAVNIHRIYLGDIEHGRSNVTLEILVRIAHHLQTDLADLFQAPPV